MQTTATQAMPTKERTEARILGARNLLVELSAPTDAHALRGFLGSVINANELSSGLPNLAQKTVYLCGDLSQARGHDLDAAERVFVIKDLSHGDDQARDGGQWRFVDSGRVPIGVHGVGVYYPRFFEPTVDHFGQICNEHAFQSLTESSKSAKAHRTGIYLTPVEQRGADLHFRLLRCSTNLSGPTENFRAHDLHIVGALNREAGFIFQDHALLNHVLAQIYNNTPAAAEQKQSKARISAHADKTKDMPANGIMAFCTFYDKLDGLRPLASDALDYGHKGTSGLSRLRFRLKEQRLEGDLPAEFTLTLYPNSVFFMPLSTNRLYTHEIRASSLDAGMIPTRLGYVVRCSRAEAVHMNGQTYLKQDGKLVQLDQPTPEGMDELRRLYAEENQSQACIDYGDDILFSMNAGDYSAPSV